MQFRFKKKGFALIELMVVLLIMSALLVFAIDEYKRHIANTRVIRAQADIDELVKAVRLFNIRESGNFTVTMFSPQALGNFVGNYLEKEPPRDPWGNFYRHSADLGVVFSCGPDGKPQTISIASETDDVVDSYLPKSFFITRAEYVDANLNNVVDISDYIELTFSRPANLIEPMAVDFETAFPAKALGSAVVRAEISNLKARIEFVAPFAPQIKPGETRLFPREYIESVVDLSPRPQRLQRREGLVIEKRK